MPLSLALILVAIVIFLLKPGINSLREKSDSIQEKVVELEVEKDKVKELPKLKEQFLSVEKNRERLNVLFAESNIIDLVQDIEKIAEETGNNIVITIEDDQEGISVKKPSRKGDDNEKKEKLLEDFSEEEYFSMDIGIVGTYVEFLKFIDRLDNLKYYNSIVSFEIKPVEDDSYGRNDTYVFEDSEVSEEETVKEDNLLDSKIRVVFYLNK